MRFKIKNTALEYTLDLGFQKNTFYNSITIAGSDPYTQILIQGPNYQYWFYKKDLISEKEDHDKQFDLIMDDFLKDPS